jgi:2-keto-3-deoxy-L-rhamnonate aldolase RhmA
VRENHTLSLLRRGEPAVGTWLQLASPAAARLVAAQGLLDWALVDFEHTPVDLATASIILSTVADVSRGHVTPLARVADGSTAAIKHALDAGAEGVIVPMVEGADEVREAARHARFPPAGDRGAGGLAPHLGFAVPRPAYVASANERVLFGVQIETRAALEDIERIVEVPGLDLCFIGPNDLHLALGLPARFWSTEPAFTRAVGRIAAACARRRIPLGTLCRDAEAARARVDDGYRFIGLGSDAHFMLTALGEHFGELRGEPAPESWCDRVRIGGG